MKDTCIFTNESLIITAISMVLIAVLFYNIGSYKEYSSGYNVGMTKCVLTTNQLDNKLQTSK